MTCELCRREGREFSTPGPDNFSLALMAGHFAEVHGDSGPLRRLAEWNRPAATGRSWRAARSKNMDWR